MGVILRLLRWPGRLREGALSARRTPTRPPAPAKVTKWT